MTLHKAKSASRTTRLLHRNSTLISHGLLTGAAAIDVVFDRTSNYGSKLALSVLLVFLASLGIARYLNLFKINKRPLKYLILYYLTIAAGVVFFGRIGTVLVYAWLLILFLTYIHYGLRAALGSLIILAVTLEAQLLLTAARSGDGISTSMALTVLVQFGVVAAMAMFFIDIEAESVHDIKKQTIDLDKVQLEHQRILSLINSMNDGVLATNEQGAITLYNAAALNVLDTNDELYGQKAQDLLKLIDADGQSVDVIKLSKDKSGYVRSQDYRLRYSDSEVINIGLTISQIKVGFGRGDKERGLVITFRDITREKSLEEERDEFISVISHELRTPVAITEANISNAIFSVDKNKDLNSVKESLHAAHEQALYLANLLNDLSTLSRAERGKLDLLPESVDPAEIVESLTSDYSHQVESKGLKLLMQIAKSTPKSITSNRLYVREILQNFITNAQKYTKEGSITLSVEGHEKGVKFSIKDTGIGISKSDQKKIFNKYFRSEDYRTRENIGTGLGLYITYKLAKIIGAEFEVESKLNAGSTFTVIIPDLKNHSPK